MADRSASSALTLRQGAELVGAYQAIESALFVLAGRWSAEPGSPGAQLYFFEASQQHAWHAELFSARRPVASGLELPPGLTAGEPATSLLAALEALGESDRPEERSVRRLSGWCRVLVPRLAVTYERHRARAIPAADGPLLRALRYVLGDLAEFWATGERLFQAELVTPDLARAAAATVGDLEAVVATSAPTPGLVSWPPAEEGEQPGDTPEIRPI